MADQVITLGLVVERNDWPNAAKSISSAATSIRDIDSAIKGLNATNRSDTVANDVAKRVSEIAQIRQVAELTLQGLSRNFKRATVDVDTASKVITASITRQISAGHDVVEHWAKQADAAKASSAEQVKAAELAAKAQRDAAGKLVRPTRPEPQPLLPMYADALTKAGQPFPNLPAYVTAQTSIIRGNEKALEDYKASIRAWRAAHKLEVEARNEAKAQARGDLAAGGFELISSQHRIDRDVALRATKKQLDDLVKQLEATRNYKTKLNEIAKELKEVGTAESIAKAADANAKRIRSEREQEDANIARVVRYAISDRYGTVSEFYRKHQVTKAEQEKARILADKQNAAEEQRALVQARMRQQTQLPELLKQYNRAVTLGDTPRESFYKAQIDHLNNAVIWERAKEKGLDKQVAQLEAVTLASNRVKAAADNAAKAETQKQISLATLRIASRWTRGTLPESIVEAPAVKEQRLKDQERALNEEARLNQRAAALNATNAYHAKVNAARWIAAGAAGAGTGFSPMLLASGFAGGFFSRGGPPGGGGGGGLAQWAGFGAAPEGIAALGTAGVAAAAGVGLLVAATLKLGSVLYNASVESVDFHRRIAEIQTISQTAQLGANQWADSIYKLSSAFAKSKEDVAEGIYQTLSNQIAKGAETFMFMRTAMELAAVTQATTRQAVDALSSAINSYGYSATEAGHLSAVFFKAVDLGRFRLEDLAGSIGRVTFSAAQMGIPIEDILAGMTTMSRKGLQAHETMTLVSNVMHQLIRPSAEMQAVLKSWGVETGQQAIATYGYIGVLRKIAEEAKNSTSRVAALFPEIRAMRGIFGQSADAMEEDAKKLKNSATQYREAVDIMMTRPGMELSTAWQGLSNSISEAGSLFMQGLDQFVRGIRLGLGITKDFPAEFAKAGKVIERGGPGASGQDREFVARAPNTWRKLMEESSFVKQNLAIFKLEDDEEERRLFERVHAIALADARRIRQLQAWRREQADILEQAARDVNQYYANILKVEDTDLGTGAALTLAREQQMRSDVQAEAHNISRTNQERRAEARADLLERQQEERAVRKEAERERVEDARTAQQEERNRRREADRELFDDMRAARQVERSDAIEARRQRLDEAREVRQEERALRREADRQALEDAKQQRAEERTAATEALRRRIDSERDARQEEREQRREALRQELDDAREQRAEARAIFKETQQRQLEDAREQRAEERALLKEAERERLDDAREARREAHDLQREAYRRQRDDLREQQREEREQQKEAERQKITDLRDAHAKRKELYQQEQENRDAMFRAAGRADTYNKTIYDIIKQSQADANKQRGVTNPRQVFKNDQAVRDEYDLVLRTRMAAAANANDLASYKNMVKERDALLKDEQDQRRSLAQSGYAAEWVTVQELAQRRMALFHEEYTVEKQIEDRLNAEKRAERAREQAEKLEILAAERTARELERVEAKRDRNEQRDYDASVRAEERIDAKKFREQEREIEKSIRAAEREADRKFRDAERAIEDQHRAALREEEKKYREAERKLEADARAKERQEERLAKIQEYEIESKARAELHAAELNYLQYEQEVAAEARAKERAAEKVDRDAEREIARKERIAARDEEANYQEYERSIERARREAERNEEANFREQQREEDRKARAAERAEQAIDREEQRKFNRDEAALKRKEAVGETEVNRFVQVMLNLKPEKAKSPGAFLEVFDRLRDSALAAEARMSGGRPATESELAKVIAIYRDHVKTQVELIAAEKQYTERTDAFNKAVAEAQQAEIAGKQVNVAAINAESAARLELINEMLRLKARLAGEPAPKEVFLPGTKWPGQTGSWVTPTTPGATGSLRAPAAAAVSGAVSTPAAAPAELATPTAQTAYSKNKTNYPELTITDYEASAEADPDFYKKLHDQVWLNVLFRIRKHIADSNAKLTDADIRQLYKMWSREDISARVTVMSKDMRAKLAATLLHVNDAANEDRLANDMARSIPHYNKGGVVDTVPAMLTPGEFVMPVDKTRKHWDLIQAIYKDAVGYEDGGLVGEIKRNFKKLDAMAQEQLLFKLMHGFGVSRPWRELTNFKMGMSDRFAARYGQSLASGMEGKAPRTNTALQVIGRMVVIDGKVFSNPNEALAYVRGRPAQANPMSALSSAIANAKPRQSEADMLRGAFLARNAVGATSKGVTFYDTPEAAFAAKVDRLNATPRSTVNENVGGTTNFNGGINVNITTPKVDDNTVRIINDGLRREARRKNAGKINIW